MQQGSHFLGTRYQSHKSCETFQAWKKHVHTKQAWYYSWELKKCSLSFALVFWYCGCNFVASIHALQILVTSFRVGCLQYNVTDVNGRATRPVEKVMMMGPQQCSLGNKVVIGYITSLKMKTSDDNIFRYHGPHLFGFSLYFYLQKTKPHPECCLLHSGLLTVV